MSVSNDEGSGSPLALLESAFTFRCPNPLTRFGAESVALRPLAKLFAAVPAASVALVVAEGAAEGSIAPDETSACCCLRSLMAAIPFALSIRDR